jgi:hypothetical protein
MDSTGMSLNGVSSEQAQTYAIAALDYPWVKSALADHTCRVVEVSDYGDGKSPTLVWIYDYDEYRSIVAAIDRSSASVVDAWVSSSTPNTSEAERVEAIEIALTDPSVVKRMADRPYTVVNITDATGGVCSGKRCLAVFLASNTADAGWIVPIVDLGKKTVVTFSR